MSTKFKEIDGSFIRQQLRQKNLPGGGERICCGGHKTFSRDYESQLRSLGYKGAFKVKERGIVAAFLEVN